MYTYWNGNEYTGAVQFDRDGNPLDAAGQPLEYTEIATTGLEPGNESGVAQVEAAAQWQGEEQSWHNVLLGLDKSDLQPNLRDEGTGFFKTMRIAFSNLGTDFVVETDHIVQAAESPIDTGEAILKTVAGYLQKALPSDWDKYLPDNWQDNKMYADAINAHFADKYGDGGNIDKEKLLDSIAEQPVSVMLDFYAIKAIATAVANKAAQTAKVTNKSTDIAIADELATYDRAVIDKGGLVWHEGMGAYVDSSMIPRLGTSMNKIDQVHPPLAANADGMLLGNRQYSNNAKIGEPISYEYPIMNRAQREAYDARIAARENARNTYVPETEVTPAAIADISKVDGPEVTPAAILDDAMIDGPPSTTVPSTTGIDLSGTRGIDGSLKVADDAAAVPLASAESVIQAKKSARAIEEKWMDIEDLTAKEVFYQNEVIPAKAAAIDAEIAAMAPDAVRAIRDANIRKIAIEQEIRYSEAAGLYNETLSTSDLAAQARLFPLIDDVQAANMIRNGASEALVVDNARIAAALQEALAARNASAVPDVPVGTSNAATKANNAKLDRDRAAMADAIRNDSSPGAEQFRQQALDEASEFRDLYRIKDDLVVGTSNAATKANNAKLARDEALMATRQDVPVTPAATTGIDLAGTRGIDGSLKVATQADVVGKSNAATRANQGKLDRDKKRMADDEIMATATQADLFKNGTAAQYEMYQASRIANDLAKVTPAVPSIVGKRMMAPTERTKLAKYADVERRTAPSVPKTNKTNNKAVTSPSLLRATSLGLQRLNAASQSMPEYPTAPDLSLRDQQEGSGELRIEPFVPIVPERIDVEQSVSERPGWKLPHQFEGSTREGNYWSADFEDEHWNTPAGIKEAIGVWGRPVGNRRIVNPR